MKHTVLAFGECYFCCWRGFFGLPKRLCLIFHSFVKILLSNMFKLMLNFVLSYMSSASSVTSNFWQLLYHSKWSCIFPETSISASDFCYCTVGSYDREEKTYCTYWLIGRAAGRKNIWLEVRAYGPSAARFVIKIRSSLKFSCRLSLV